MSEGSVLIRINLTDSYAASTTIKINSSTIAEEVCNILSLKLNINEQDKVFDSLICVINGYDGKNNIHWLKTLKKHDNILNFQSLMLKKRAMRIKNQDLIDSLNVTWYYKDIRSTPLNLDGDTSGNSSDDEEKEISLNDLIYFGSGDRRAMLLKRSHTDPNLWRKRLCILNDKLWCINLKKKAPYANCIELNGKVMLQDEAPDLNYPNGIIIQNPNQSTHFFRAASISEQHMWKDDLLDRAAFGIENSVLYMGEMIICDEEFARCSKKNKVTRNSIQRKLIWKHLKEIVNLESNDFIQDNNHNNNDNDDDNHSDNDNSNNLKVNNDNYTNGINNKNEEVIEQEFEQHDVQSITSSISPNNILMEMINDNDNNNNNKIENLNADQVFLHRSPRERMETCLKYRSTNTNSFYDFKNQEDYKRLRKGGSSNDLLSSLVSSSPTIITTTTTTTSAPMTTYSISAPHSPASTTNLRPESISSISRGRRSVTESYSRSSSAIDISPIPLSSLPNSPVQLLHSFHCYSPHLTASISLIDSIHDYKSAFRHDLHMKSSYLWSIALKVYYNSLSRYIYLISSHQRNSPWNIVKDKLQLNIQSSITSSKSDSSINIMTNEQFISELNEDQKEIYFIIEKIQNTFISNLQKEIKIEKKVPVKKKVESTANYWFWPSTEPDEKKQNDNENDEKKNQNTLPLVGYGFQLIDSSIKPPISLFDELLPEHILTNKVYECHNNNTYKISDIDYNIV